MNTANEPCGKIEDISMSFRQKHPQILMQRQCEHNDTYNKTSCNVRRVRVRVRVIMFNHLKRLVMCAGGSKLKCEPNEALGRVRVIMFNHLERVVMCAGGSEPKCEPNEAPGRATSHFTAS